MTGQASESSNEDSKESLYSILNLPISASQDDIRHRYKELAVVFHPDRQTQKDEDTRRVAEKRFRQIQRAYEILTDPVQRQIYDTLGESGLVARRAVGQRYSSPEELRAELERLVEEARGMSGSRKSVTSLGEFICSFDVNDFFAPDHSLPSKGRLSARLSGISHTLLRVQHTMGLNFKNGTEASLTGRLQAVPYPSAPRDYGNLLGTIRHQFSPRIQIEATANILRSHALNLKTSYTGDENHVTLKTHVSQKVSLLLPPLTLELQRRLFVESSTQGHLIFATGPQPSFTASLESPSGSRGFAWSTGFQLSRFPRVSTELATRRLSGGFRAKLGVELGLTGLSGAVHGIWTGGEERHVSVAVGASQAGAVYTSLTIELLGQRIHIPIVLSHEADVMIGLCALLVPSTVAALAHNFMIKPRLRARRISQLQAARHAHRITIQQCREEAEQTINILSESVRRRVEHERANDGLVILSGTYTASGEEGESPISIDVTIALQAQVHNSQLLIPGGRSKVALLGFYDPSPGARKHLKIEYVFHGALHIVEVGDFSQVVLPLRAHLAE